MTEFHEHYILGGDDGRTPIPVDLVTARAWKMRVGLAGRRVGYVEFGDLKAEGVAVSTVFCTYNEAYDFQNKPPLVFETMVFGGDLDGERRQYSTWAKAKDGHRAMVARVKRALADHGPTAPGPIDG